jgi:hypothetical protein
MDMWARFRNHLSVAHLQAADFFCQESGRIEHEYTESDDSELLSQGDYHLIQHRSLVIGSIFSAVAFLEAAINEFFADAADGERHVRERLDGAVVSRISRLWRLDIPRTARYSLLQKYEIAASLADVPILSRDSAVYQEVVILTRLRNALMHFEPETVRIRLGDRFQREHRFDKFLKGKFRENPLVRWLAPHYPDLYLSHSCASWAVKSAINFVDDFFFRMTIDAPYEYLEAEGVRVRLRESYR